MHVLGEVTVNALPTEISCTFLANTELADSCICSIAGDTLDNGAA